MITLEREALRFIIIEWLREGLVRYFFLDYGGVCLVFGGFLGGRFVIRIDFRSNHEWDFRSNHEWDLFMNKMPAANLRFFWYIFSTEL